MYIDMDTRSIIIPKGKYFVKDGKKIEDKYLDKYDLDTLVAKWNIWKVIVKSKKDEQYYKIVKKTYKKDKERSTVTLTWTTKPKFTLDELKEKIKNTLISNYKVMYSDARRSNNACAFLSLPEDPVDQIRGNFHKAMDAVDAIKKYDDLVEWRDDA